MEKIGELIVYRQEFLDLPWRFEPLHDPLSSPRRLMRILRPIVQPFVLAVFHVQAHVLARCAIGSELVRDHDARRSRGFFQQLPHKPLRGGSISSALNEDIENEAVLIDGASSFQHGSIERFYPDLIDFPSDGILKLANLSLGPGSMLRWLC